MGIHSGPVNEVTDLNAQANIAGAGINIAQRVMDCGDAGHILLSKRVADDLDAIPTLAATFTRSRRVRSKTRDAYSHVQSLYRHVRQRADATEIPAAQNVSSCEALDDSHPVGARYFRVAVAAFFIIDHIKANPLPTRTGLFSRISRTRLVIPFLTAPYDKDSPRSSSRHHFSLWSQIRSSPRP